MSSSTQPPRYDFRLEDLRDWHLIEKRWGARGEASLTLRRLAPD